MVENERVRRLLRVKLKLLRQLNPNAAWLEKLDHGGTILQVGTGTIAEAVASTTILQVEETRRVCCIKVADLHTTAQVELSTHARMPVLGQCLRKLHAKAMDLQVIAVLIAGKQIISEVRNGLAHGDQL